MIILMKRWKYHEDSGAFEFYQTADEQLLSDAAKTTKQLTKENAELKENLNKILGLLTQKNILTKEEADQFLPDSEKEVQSNKKTVQKTRKK